MANRVKITFNEDMQIGDHLWFLGYLSYGADEVDIQFQEQWKSVRTQAYQVTYNPPTLIAGERSAIDFVTAFNIDFGSYGVSASRTLNVVTIISDNENLTFYEGGVYGSIPSSRCSFEFSEISSEYFLVNKQVYPSLTNICEEVRVLIETNIQTNNFFSQVTGNLSQTTNPFYVSLPRAASVSGVNYSFSLYSSITNTQISDTVFLPPILNPDAFTINVNYSPVGGIINITNPFIGLNITYSLDNENWQSDGNFTGLLPGEYIVWFQDQFGCKKRKRVVVSSDNINTPYFLYDKNNSFRMANRVDWGTGGNYKNDENTLSCEAFARNEKLAYKEIQRFQTNDIITTQFKSNYPINQAFVVLDDDTEIEIAVVKKSQNIGLKSMMDGFLYNIGDGLNAIYFTTGNIYDYDTETPTGEMHYINGGLPSWFGKTKYFVIDGVWYLIENVFYDEERHAEVIVFSGGYTGNSDQGVKIGTIYNREPYEIYEFEIDFDQYIDRDLRVRIEAKSDDWVDITLLSELIQVKVSHDDCVEIRYWNDENTNINYQTGIRHLLRIPIDNISGVSEGESENNKTDTTTILLNSELYEADNFKFEPVTKELWRKLMRALSCKNVFIQNVQYVKNGEFETEGPLEDSNLYVLTAKMIKAGSVFSAQSDGLDDFDFGGSEIVGLIDAGSQSYIKY